MTRRASVIGLAAALFLASTAAPAQAGDLKFRNMTSVAGLDYLPTTPRIGASVGDFDGDGWLDICLSGGLDPKPHIFRNRGAELLGDAARSGGSGGGVTGSAGLKSKALFEDVSAHVLPLGIVDASHALFADLDNDGDPDLVLAEAFGSWQHTGLAYYENINGQFIPGHLVHDPGRDPTSLGGLALGDVDNDGDLDVVFMHNQGGPGFLLRNELPGGFVDVTATLGPSLGVGRRHWTAVLADFTGNGLPDLHVAIDGDHDFHCRNPSGTGLHDASVEAGVSNVGADMGVAVGDPDNDGDLDLYSTNINVGVLYMNNGAGVFHDEAGFRGVANFGGLSAVIGWGTVFSDFDHDLDEDLALVGMSNPGKLFQNDGNGFFQDATDGAGLHLEGRGLISFDYDNDGDLDLLVTDTELMPALFENRTPAASEGHWLIVDPVGAFSNRDAVGARITVTAGGQSRVRVILAGHSFYNGPPMNAHFGLGSASQATSIVIQWPSGKTQTLDHVAVDRRIQVYEMSADLDRDCRVGGWDLLVLILHLGSVHAALTDGDLNGDGDVDFEDLFGLLLQFGDQCTNHR